MKTGASRMSRGIRAATSRRAAANRAAVQEILHRFRPARYHDAGYKGIGRRRDYGRPAANRPARPIEQGYPPARPARLPLRPPHPQARPDIQIRKVRPSELATSDCLVSLVNNGSVAPAPRFQFSDISAVESGKRFGRTAPPLYRSTRSAGRDLQRALPQLAAIARFLGPHCCSSRRVDVHMAVKNPGTGMLKEPVWRVPAMRHPGETDPVCEISGDLLSRRGGPHLHRRRYLPFRITVRNSGPRRFDGTGSARGQSALPGRGGRRQGPIDSPEWAARPATPSLHFDVRRT